MVSRLRDATSIKQTNSGEKAFLPIRQFRQECLLTGNGASILEKLLENRSLVIVVDADLRPNDLARHRDRIRQKETAAVDMTGSLKLKGHYAYALLQAGDPGLKALKGQRLW